MLLGQRIAKSDPETLKLVGLVRFDPRGIKYRLQEAELLADKFILVARIVIEVTANPFPLLFNLSQVILLRQIYALFHLRPEKQLRLPMVGHARFRPGTARIPCAVRRRP